jgi:hypothetical protein
MSRVQQEPSREDERALLAHMEGMALEDIAVSEAVPECCDAILFAALQ